METDGAEAVAGGAPELNALGKQIELLRIDRGISKQQLARQAGTSRQQLWRVMTGKSELTSALCQRLAEVLQVDARELRQWCGGRAGRSYPGPRPPGPAVAPETFPAYVTDPEALLRTLRTLPRDPDGRRLAREVLNCVELVAAEAGIRLAPSFFRVRGRVVNGEL
jgi:transcriptional regulator with XRE-family HTH domain